MSEITLEGESVMAELVADLDIDCAENILNESMQSHSDLMHDTRANIQSAHNVLRHSGVRKYNEEDPIETAAVEMILTK